MAIRVYDIRHPGPAYDGTDEPPQVRLALQLRYLKIAREHCEGIESCFDLLEDYLSVGNPVLFEALTQLDELKSSVKRLENDLLDGVR